MDIILIINVDFIKIRFNSFWVNTELIYKFFRELKGKDNQN